MDSIVIVLFPVVVLLATSACALCLLVSVPVFAFGLMLHTGWGSVVAIPLDLYLVTKFLDQPIWPSTTEEVLVVGATLFMGLFVSFIQSNTYNNSCCGISGL